MNIFVDVILFLVISAKTLPIEDNETTDKLKVQVYYESKCPGCMLFFTSRLLPSMRHFGRLQYTDLELIPFGYAEITTDPDTHELTVECQHGQEECRDNAIHACIIETVEIGKAIDVIACLMRDNFITLNKCAREFSLDVRPVETCLKKRTNAEILKKYGEETEKVNPQFVPFVVFDDKFDSAKMDNVPYFDREFCKAYKAKYGKELDACSLNFNVSPQKDLNSTIEQLDYFQSAQLNDFKLTKCSKDPKA